MQDSLDTLTAPVYAAALVLLWMVEALMPAFEGWREARAQRLRHLALAAINAAAAAGLAFAVVGVIALCDRAGFGLLRWTDAHPIVAFVTAFLLLDATQYAMHIAAHKVPALWRLHSVHHNATRMEATAAMRFHTIEVCFTCLAPIPVIALAGISVPQLLLYHLVLMPVAMFHHADLRMPAALDRRLRWLIVTPRMHWIHHSRWQPETDSNYAAVLSVWDRLFGTFRSRRHAETVEFGLDGFIDEDTETLKGWLLSPFGERKAELGEKPPSHLLVPDEPGSDRSTKEHDHPRRATPASATMRG